MLVNLLLVWLFAHGGDVGSTTFIGLFLAVAEVYYRLPSLHGPLCIVVQNNPHHLLSLPLRFNMQCLFSYLSLQFISEQISFFFKYFQ